MISEKQTFGSAGNITLTSAQDALTGDFFCIQVITDTVFSVLTDSSQITGGASSVAPTYPAGFTLFGQFKSIDLTSGSVRVYRNARRQE